MSEKKTKACDLINSDVLMSELKAGKQITVWEKDQFDRLTIDTVESLCYDPDNNTLSIVKKNGEKRILSGFHRIIIESDSEKSAREEFHRPVRRAAFSR